MNRLKNNAWAMVLFVVTSVALALAIANTIITIMGINEVVEAAIQATRETTPDATEEALQFAGAVAKGAAIAAMVFALSFSVLIAIGGYMYSLKGKWGVFCLVVAILKIIGVAITLFGMVGKSIQPLNLVTNILDIVMSGLFVVSVFMLRRKDTND